MSFELLISRYLLYFYSLKQFKTDIVQYSRGTKLTNKPASDCMS